MPHREFEMYDAWLGMQWNRPDRHDHYLMKFMTVVVGLFSKKGTNLDPNTFRIDFVETKPTKVTSPEGEADKTKIAKAATNSILKRSKAKPVFKTKPNS